MPGAQPAGDPAPDDGRLSNRSLATLGSRPFGVYVHVPFCATRCGYCDFNTYTADELGTTPGASRAGWADAVLAEWRLARTVLGASRPPIDTVFFGGGTPTLLPPADLLRVLDALRDDPGLADDAEVSVEANPETLTPQTLAALRSGGVTRLSMGMQSATAHVLAVLDRVHTTGRVAAAVTDARAAGFDSLSLDLIYGTPGESLADWAHTVDVTVGLAPDHVSAYALIVEPGTRLAGRVARGQVAAPDDEAMASMYEVADEALAQAGFAWYEVSNWARGPRHRSRHNLHYWRDTDWWGLGPGAHSHVGGVRWWNVKHPAAWSQRLDAGLSPAQARETLDEATRRLERIMLGLRTADGAAVADVAASVGPQARVRLDDMVGDGLVQPAPLRSGRVTLTRRGRLLADAVTLRLT
ncbi:MAG: radical SAM family heme chaperone HemW [Jiangellales bacterium]